MEVSCHLGADIKQHPDGLQPDGWDYTAAWRAAQCGSQQRKGAWKFVLQTSESSLFIFDIAWWVSMYYWQKWA